MVSGNCVRVPHSGNQPGMQSIVLDRKNQGSIRSQNKFNLK